MTWRISCPEMADSNLRRVMHSIACEGTMYILQHKVPKQLMGRVLEQPDAQDLDLHWLGYSY